MNEQPPKPVCLITGGSSGIGLATAKLFAKQGFHVAICGRRKEALETAKKLILRARSDQTTDCFTMVADLEDVEQAKNLGQQVLDHFGRIDVLVNNAAVAPLAAMEDIGSETFEASIKVNIESVFYLTQLVWRHMKQRAAEPAPTDQGRGVIVNISSLAAVDPFPGFSLYGASKAWLDLMTQALAAEGKELGIRVCSIRPGAVETPLLRGLFPDFPADQCVAPEQVAELIWGCVSQPERFPSGSAIPVTNQP